MKVAKKPGSGIAKIHIEDDGSYFQVRQVRTLRSLRGAGGGSRRREAGVQIPVTDVATLKLTASQLSHWSHSLATGS